ncbi:MAG TPA: alpha/beta hydrolase [Solirubrobacteraceae bacterium]|nr:alpha/beta hydrolase [Solirubrobacteraceae bacterium]
MIERSTFTATTSAGSLAGWFVGDGPRLLLLHGGPGLRYDYMLPLVAELEADFRVAIFQQRGLEPSTVDGPFTMAQAIEDVVGVLDALGWSRALMVGHSWGGHLGLRFAAAHPERLLGMLAVDPLGIVGDGGMAAFQAEMLARAPRAGRQRMLELDEVEKVRELTTQEQLETRRIIWPSYFADPENVPPMPPYVSSTDANKGLTAELSQGADEVAAALATGAVRYGIVVGGASPFPWGQSARADAELSPGAFLTVVPQAGHFVWYEAPGAVRAAVDRLANSA